jgi:ribA/ribD-fused uncharacterized protein
VVWPSPVPNQMITYRKTEVAWFYRKVEQHWELSNMAGGMSLYWPVERSPINLWGSSEQLYQACKYGSQVMCLPESSPDADPCVRNRIRAQKAPRGAKMTQKCAEKAGLVRSDWESPDEVRLKAMLWVLELKLYWNRQTFGRVLESTEDKPIVEVSTKDDFWGCMEHGNELRGQNHLGILLMQVRQRIPLILRRDFTYPAGFLLP